MSLLPCTQRIIETVERVTNRPVLIQEDTGLTVLAQMRVARGDDPMHLLRYKPRGTVPPDYFIAYECGFVLRLFEAPPERRFDYTSNDAGRRRMIELLSDTRLPPAVRDRGVHLLDQLLTQLRSISVGLRVDEWLLANHGELRDLQASGTRTQLDTNLETIPLGAKGVFPAAVWKANVTMNAAFAAFWSRQWNDATLTLPYRSAGLLEGGLELLRAYDAVPADPGHDPDLIEQWARALGLNGWLEAVPYRLND